MTAPLTPRDCDLRDFPRMMIDIPRLFGSEFDATANDAEWRCGVTLWLKSFHQVPAASLPDDDAALARLCGLGRDVRSWKKCRDMALRGWVKASDGLLYHPVVAEIALEAWLDKLTQRLSSGAGNASRWGVEFDPEPIKAEIATAALLLADLNPKSRALTKQQAALALRKSRRETPTVVPTGRTPDPGGTTKPVPSGSQGKGREGKESSVSDETGAERRSLPLPDPEDELAGLRAEPVARGAFYLAMRVLTERGDLAEAKARPLVAKWRHTLADDEELWRIGEAAWKAETRDPVPYIVAAVERAVQARAGSGVVNPSEPRQRAWMEEFARSPNSWRAGDRGPRPGEPGCRVSPEIQREFGIEPAAPFIVDRGAA